MARQSTEDENDGMTRWFEAEYAGEGFKAHRVSNNRTRLRLPKQADNIGELITRAYEEHGAICDLSLDKDGRSELTFWSVAKPDPEKEPEDDDPKPTQLSPGVVAKICTAVAVLLFLVAVADYFLTPKL
jgi:hypothetical protein